MESESRIPGKLLLFGEYTVLHGGRALAVPAGKWSGSWTTDVLSEPDRTLLDWADYLEAQQIWPADTAARMAAEVKQGLKFQSHIPEGYGLGSSGALTAAAFERYRELSPDLPLIRTELAAMESFFHGSSSGMDPLVSLLNCPVLREEETFHLLDSRRLVSDAGPFMFLVDSGKPRQTRELVKMYQEMQNDEAFVAEVARPMMQASDHAIACLLDMQWDLFWQFLSVLSELQFRNLSRFIPDNIKRLNTDLTGQGGIHLKLCGAGGGGMFLGFARSQGLLDAVGNRQDVIVLS